MVFGQEVELGDPPLAPPVGGFKAVGTPAERAVGEAWYNTADRELVRMNYRNIFLAARTVPLGWAGNVATGVWGDTSPAYKSAVAARLNWLRAMAGVPANVTLNLVNSGKAQQAAMMMSANRQLSHSPPPSWLNYTAQGAEAAGNSNLCLGFSSDPGCVEQYMMDAGSNNGAAGHRRWILYPQTQQFGSGDIPASAGYPSANALWVFDGRFGAARPETRDSFVAWPPPGYFPYNLEPIRYSFSYPGADFSAATVTMTRGGVAVTPVKEPVQNGYGENALVWYRSGQNTSSYPAIPASSPDVPVDISIGNVRINGAPQSFTYRVTLFDTAGGPSGPSTVSVSPASGSYSSRSVTFTYAHTGGFQQLDVVNGLINSFLDGRQGCYFAYSRPLHVLYLVNDAGTALLPGLPLAAGGSIGNSYCTLSADEFSVAASGSQLALTLNVSFSVGFAGDRVVYVAARDSAGGNSGWQPRGAFRVAGGIGALSLANLSPSDGSGVQRTFTLTFADAVSGNNISNAQVLIGRDLNGNNACYIGYVRQGNQLYLVDDQSPTLLPALTPGSGTGSAQNSQCTVSGVGLSAVVQGPNLVLTLPITFKSAFAGPKVVYGAAQTTGGANSGWQARGVWSVP